MRKILILQKLYLTQVDSSSPPVFFYGTTETEVGPSKDRPKIDPRYRSDDFRPSSLWIEPDSGPTSGFKTPDTYSELEPKVKPRRHNQVSDQQQDLVLKNEVEPMEKVEARNDEKVRNQEKGVEPRHDRMDDFQPFGGLVAINDTMLRAVGLVQEKVILTT